MEKAENYYKPPPNKITIEPVKSAEPSQELKQAQIKIQETESELKKVEHKSGAFSNALALSQA